MDMRYVKVGCCAVPRAHEAVPWASRPRLAADKLTVPPLATARHSVSQTRRVSNHEVFPLLSENIEELGLSWTSIEVVPTSIKRLTKLRELLLSQCKRLKNLPDTIGSLESLRHLWLAHCPNITSFPVLGHGIETLALNGTGIEEVPSSIGDKLNLVFLDMSKCQRLQNLPLTLSNLKNLKLLYLRGCTNITELPRIAGEMRKLDLYGTSIEIYGSLSEEEALELRNRDMDSVKKLLTRHVRKYKKNRKSR